MFVSSTRYSLIVGKMLPRIALVADELETERTVCKSTEKRFKGVKDGGCNEIYICECILGIPSPKSRIVLPRLQNLWFP